MANEDNIKATPIAPNKPNCHKLFRRQTMYELLEGDASQSNN